MNSLLLSFPNHQLLNVHLGGKLTLPPPVKIELFVVDLPPLSSAQRGRPLPQKQKCRQRETEKTRSFSEKDEDDASKIIPSKTIFAAKLRGKISS